MLASIAEIGVGSNLTVSMCDHKPFGRKDGCSRTEGPRSVIAISSARSSRLGDIFMVYRNIRSSNKILAFDHALPQIRSFLSSCMIQQEVRLTAELAYRASIIQCCVAFHRVTQKQVSLIIVEHFVPETI